MQVGDLSWEANAALTRITLALGKLHGVAGGPRPVAEERERVRAVLALYEIRERPPEGPVNSLRELPGRLK